MQSYVSTALSYLAWLDSAVGLRYIAAMYAALLVLEYFVGRKERASWKTIAANCAFLLTTLPILVIVRAFATGLATDLSKAFGGPWIDLTFAGGGTFWGQIGAVLIVTLIYDLFYYWHHRLQHAVPAAWLTHVIHHADEDMGVTTGYKHHWTDDALRIVTMFIPIGLLFKLEPMVTFWLSFLFSFHQLFLHCNINLSFGPIVGRIIASPSQHRVHHSKLEKHWDKNFAATWSFIDVVFGTYYHPPKEAPPTGVSGRPQFTNLIEGHAYPFLGWFAMARDALRGYGVRAIPARPSAARRPEGH